MIAECAGSVSVKAMGKLLSGAGGERRGLNDGTVLLSPMLPCGKFDENATYRGQKRGWFCNRLSAVYALWRGGGGNRERRLKDLTVLPPAREYLHLCVDEDILEDKSMGWEN